MYSSDTIDMSRVPYILGFFTRQYEICQPTTSDYE